MRLSQESIFRYLCTNCCGSWTVADKTPPYDGSITCPHCYQALPVQQQIQPKLLFHCRCSNCHAYWTFEHKAPDIGTVLACPECDLRETVEGIDSYLDKPTTHGSNRVGS